MVWRWSKTAATNAAADSTINWAEGMAPSAVNDSARAEMARVAQYRDDICGAILTTGTSTAYVVTSNQVFDTLAHMDGAMIAFTPHVINGATVTLNVDGLGAKPLRFGPSFEVQSNSLLAGTPYVATYNNTDSAWYLQGFNANPYGIPIAMGSDYWGTTTPSSAFAFPYGQALSRTTYASCFAILGTTFGAGDGSTTFNLMDLRGRFPQISDNMGGSGASRSPFGYGQSGGAQSVTLSQGNLPPHDHTVIGNTSDDTPDHDHSTGILNGSRNASSGADFLALSATGSSGSYTTGGAGARHVHGVNLTSGNGPGSSTAFSILPPTLGCNYILRII